MTAFVIIELVAYAIIGVATFLFLGGAIFLAALGAYERIETWSVERATRKRASGSARARRDAADA